MRLPLPTNRAFPRSKKKLTLSEQRACAVAARVRYRPAYCGFDTVRRLCSVVQEGLLGEARGGNQRLCRRESRLRLLRREANPPRHGKCKHVRQAMSLI